MHHQRSLHGFTFIALAALLAVVYPALPTRAAFTLNVASGNDTVERNTQGTWCFYPTFPESSTESPSTTNDEPELDSLDCSSMSEPQKGDLRAVLRTHLTQRPTDSLSIAYYSASLVRLGGASYLVDTVPGSKVYLCVSGQDVTQRDTNGDGILDPNVGGRYKTICEVAEKDNEFGLLDAKGERREGKTVCAVEVSQRNVTDGCYVPYWMQVLAETDDAGTMGLRSFLPVAALAVASAFVHLLVPW